MLHSEVRKLVNGQQVGYIAGTGDSHVEAFATVVEPSEICWIRIGMFCTVGPEFHHQPGEVIEALPTELISVEGLGNLWPLYD